MRLTLYCTPSASTYACEPAAWRYQNPFFPNPDRTYKSWPTRTTQTGVQRLYPPPVRSLLIRISSRSPISLRIWGFQPTVISASFNTSRCAGPTRTVSLAPPPLNWGATCQPISQCPDPTTPPSQPLRVDRSSRPHERCRTTSLPVSSGNRADADDRARSTKALLPGCLRLDVK